MMRYQATSLELNDALDDLYKASTEAPGTQRHHDVLLHVLKLVQKAVAECLKVPFITN